MRYLVPSDLAPLRSRSLRYDEKLMTVILHMDIYLGPVQEPSPGHRLESVEDSHITHSTKEVLTSEPCGSILLTHCKQTVALCNVQQKLVVLE
jgi:hypothetical protein